MKTALIDRKDKKPVQLFDNAEEIKSVFIENKEYKGIVLGLKDISAIFSPVLELTDLEKCYPSVSFRSKRRLIKGVR
jgi:hypothetical protein